MACACSVRPPGGCSHIQCYGSSCASLEWPGSPSLTYCQCFPHQWHWTLTESLMEVSIDRDPGFMETPGLSKLRGSGCTSRPDWGPRHVV